MEEELKDYGLHVVWNDDQNSEPIDFAIADEDDNVCWVWGRKPNKDIQVECNHPNECVVFSDDEPTGWCELCGASCACHYETDAGNVEDYYWSGRRLVPHSWEMPDEPKGIIGDYIKKLKEDF